MLQRLRPLLFLAATLPLGATAGTAGPRLLDDFSSLAPWTAHAAEGTSAHLRRAAGPEGAALALEFDLSRAYGHAIARRDLALDLPDNYEFTFDLRAESGVNNFEVKLIDEHDNVWWIKRLSVALPSEWTPHYLRKRHFTFAWGPSRQPEIRRVKAIEFVISSATGGRGTLYVSNLRLAPIDDAAARTARPRVTAGAGVATPPDHGDALTGWRVPDRAGPADLTVDFGHSRELGALVLDWAGAGPGDYAIDLSPDGNRWRRVADVAGSNGGRDWLHLPELQARFLRLSVPAPAAQHGFTLTGLAVRGPESGTTENDFLAAVARDHPRGQFPKYLLGEQLYWTVVGSPHARIEALLSETGAIEVDQGAFTIEPFLHLDGRLLTWADVALSHSLEKNYLPIPSVEWRHGELVLTTTALAAGSGEEDSRLFARYELRNTGSTPLRAKLFLAVRPFQVNPPWQSLFRPAGWSRTERVHLGEDGLRIDGRTIVPLDRPDGFGATAFAGGEIVEHLRSGALPPGASASDPQGFASGALAYEYELPPGGVRAIHLLTPLGASGSLPAPNQPAPAARQLYAESHAATRTLWESMLDRFDVRLPASAQPIIDTLKSNLAYIFINQDGPRIQPGSRNYQRSWIRDGSLTSTALLQFGLTDEVRDFATWYARFQFPNGKIPCVVDELGADPTDEHDSHGQMIYLILQTHHYTRDLAWLRSQWPTVVRTVDFIRHLRAQRKTPEYRDGPPEQRAFHGLVPESISHEGYSAHPMHSYWDNFFILRGLKDAVTIAGLLGETAAQARFTADVDDCARDLYASIDLAMRNAGVDFIPGCAELGDFDATSTTIALDPGGERNRLPAAALARTFDRYWERFEARRDGRLEWLDFTPYETRVIGTFVLLGRKDRAHAALDYFMAQRRPAAWNHWAEVVFRDPATPRMIGDMPHTWCGSDFMRSVRTMFAHEREEDGALLLAAGLADAWVLDPAGVRVRDLPTHHGPVSYTILPSTEDGETTLTITIDGSPPPPPGKTVLASPLARPIRTVEGDGTIDPAAPGEIVIAKLPARLTIRY